MTKITPELKAQGWLPLRKIEDNETDGIFQLGEFYDGIMNIDNEVCNKKQAAKIEFIDGLSFYRKLTLIYPIQQALEPFKAALAELENHNKACGNAELGNAKIHIRADAVQALIKVIEGE